MERIDLEPTLSSPYSQFQGEVTIPIDDDPHELVPPMSVSDLHPRRRFRNPTDLDKSAEEEEKKKLLSRTRILVQLTRAAIQFLKDTVARIIGGSDKCSLNHRGC